MMLLPKTNWEDFGGAQRREETICPATLSETLTGGNHLDWEMCALPGRFLSQNKLGHRQDDWPEATWKANPIIITPETELCGKQFCVPLPCYSPPRLPVKSFALLVCVSPQTILFWVLDKSPFLGPRSGSFLVISPYCRTTFAGSSWFSWWLSW